MIMFSCPVDSFLIWLIFYVSCPISSLYIDTKTFAASSDYYATLGVPKSATVKEIKAAY
jgi:hypothetical protein